MNYIKVKAKVYKGEGHNTTITIDQSQIDDIQEKLTDLVEWSTNRIADELKPTCIGTGIDINKKHESLFSDVIKWFLASLFITVGLFIGYSIITKWSEFWTGGINKLAVVFVGVISVVCFALGISVFKEKDRNYIIAMFSALVSLVALIVSIFK